MARPKKQTVDYFPHSCKHGKTIFILQQRYQAKGYAFWFKLLEQLGGTDGHFLDLSKEDALEFLSAETWFSPTETLEVLDLLARIDAIDQKLWEKKIVWSDNFVKNIEGVYSKRTVPVPDKPVSGVRNRISVVDNTQSKVKETRVEETKVVSNTALRAPTPAQIAKEFFSGEIDHPEIIAYFVSKGVSEKVIEGELSKFIMYWTEPNKSGTKVRWEMQKTFEIRRRLFTWFNRANQSYSTSPRETKGITI